MLGLRLSTQSITALELRDRMQQGNVLVLDVRRDSELCSGILPGARTLALHRLEELAAAVLPERDAPIVVYCAHGIRSAQALELLRRLGYTQVMHLDGGFGRWQELGLPTEVNATAPCSIGIPERYSRQVLLGEVGTVGQQKLGNSRILLVGLGGLGSPAALYLAGAGVGTLGLVDPDVVDLSNLHRQILHDTRRIGTSKVESGAERIGAVNPDVRVLGFAERFTSDNAARILEPGWDVILDGADNFPTRYIINEVATQREIPVCHGSIDRFEGRVTTFLGSQGPCYRCLFPRPPEPGVIGACAERGVLGVLPGVIGVLQATEAMKLVLGIGQPLVGRLLTYDALKLRFHELRYASDPNCLACRTRAMMGGR